MGVNRFDTPAQAQFINTYVPIPFEEMMKVGQIKQERYDRAMAAADAAVARAEQLTAIPNSEDQSYIEDVQKTMYEIRDKYVVKDLTDTMVIRQMNNEINSRLDKNLINHIQQSYGGWQKYMQQKASMEAKGQKVYDDFDFTGYSSRGKEHGGKGIFTGLPVMDLGAQAEDAIDKFLKTAEMKWRTADVTSDRKGIEHYKDINTLYALIDSESGELRDNPAIQQFMERNNLDEEGFKEILKKRAPNYIVSQISSTWNTSDEKTPHPPYMPAPFDVSGTETESIGDLNLRKIEKRIGSLLASSSKSQKEKGREMEAVYEKIKEEFGDKISPDVETAKDDLIKELEGFGPDVVLSSLLNSIMERPGDFTEGFSADLIASSKFHKDINKEQKKAIVNYAKKLKEFQSETLKGIEGLTLDLLNETVQVDYTLEPPITYSAGVDYIVNRFTGENVGPSDFSPIMKVNLLNPKDISIIGTEGKDGKPIKNFDKNILKEYIPININTQTELRFQYQYKPVVEINLQRRDDENDIITVKMAVNNERQHQALVNDHMKAGNIETATILSSGNVTKQVDEMEYDEPTSIDLPTGDAVDVKPGDFPGTYVVNYQGIEYKGSREYVKKLLYQFMYEINKRTMFLQ